MYVGEFEELVLLAICGLDEAYAVPIHQRIVHKAGRPATLGGVYRALSRLEKKGFVRSRMGEVTRVPGGKRKRLYEVTGSGLTAVRAMRTARDRLWEGLDIKPAV